MTYSASFFKNIFILSVLVSFVVLHSFNAKAQEGESLYDFTEQGQGEDSELLPEEPGVSVIPTQETTAESGELSLQVTKPPEPGAVIPVRTLTGDPMIEDMVRRTLINKNDIDVEQIPSLFFTSWELGLIQDARKGLVTRAPTDSEVESSIRDAENNTRPPMGPRELVVGGIIYSSANDWTLWLNSQKITPDRLPPEILDISVGKDYVRLKWFDAYTNQIFPVKIKTHQRFNIDTRIFLPG